MILLGEETRLTLRSVEPSRTIGGNPGLVPIWHESCDGAVAGSKHMEVEAFRHRVLILPRHRQRT
jgi:hypothetical protein